MKNVYWLDPELRIVAVGEEWEAFARANGGDGLLVESIRRRSIWEFIAGDATRMWFDAIVQLATLKKEPVVRSYRCDAPDLRRYMEMAVVREPSGLLRFEHEVLAVESRTRPVVVRQVSLAAPGGALSRCSVCGRIRCGRCWIESDQVEGSEAGILEVVHTVCPDCSLACTGVGYESNDRLDVHARRR